MATERRQQVERLARAAPVSRELPASSPQEPHSTRRISSTIMCPHEVRSLSVSERRIR